MSNDIKVEQGMRVGNYSLTVKLGQGTFSETWLAEHCYLENKEICLKIFTSKRFCSNLSKQKFLSVIKSPEHFPHLEDYDPKSIPPYLAQELLNGRSVRQLLRERKQLPMNFALNIIEKIIDVLKIMHEKNMAHLDLRPEHIFLDKENNIKLLDYSLGKVTTLTMAGYYKDYINQKVALPKAILRSLIYKPKRQRAGFEFNARADIFALGILLFEMVTGAYPNRKAALPSDVVDTLPTKIDNIYLQCCGRADEIYEDINQLKQSIRNDNSEKMVANIPGVSPIDNTSAIVAVEKLMGGKNYVDGNNVRILSKGLDEITISRLRFIALDFLGVAYLSSSAIGFLINFNDRVLKMGGCMVMFHVDTKVMTILGALGLEKVVDIVDNMDEAKEHIRNAQ